MESENPAVETGQTETGATEQQPVVEKTPEQEQAATQESVKRPSQEDLTKGIAKQRAIAKEMEAKYKESQAELAKLRSAASTVSNANMTPNVPSDPEVDRGLDLIDQRFEARLAPIKEKLDASERANVTDKFWQDPTAKAMAPEIQEAFNSPNLRGLDYAERLEAAKGLAIANNLTTFQKVYEDRGKEIAYQNQSLKTSQASGNGTGGRELNVEQKNLLEKLQSGEIRPGSPEYMANRNEILALERKEAGA